MNQSWFSRSSQCFRGGMALVSVMLALFCHPLRAGNGDKVIVPFSRAPQNAFSTQSGLQLQVDSTWTGTRGYRPVRVTAELLQPATADRLITIRYHAGNYRNNQDAISIEADFELPQGSSRSSTEFSVPQYMDWDHVGWEVWVDGVKDEELTIESMGFNSGAPNAVSTGVLDGGAWNASTTRILQYANQSVETFDFRQGNFPDQWIDLSTLDAFSTTLRFLKLLHITAPEDFERLLRWVRAGGNLWVLEVGDNYGYLAELEGLLSPVEPSEWEDEVPLEHWHFLQLGNEGQARLKDVIRLTMQEKEGAGRLTPNEIVLREEPARAADSREWFQARAWGLGTIAAFTSSRREDDFNRNYAGGILHRSAMAQNLNWATRHGNDPGIGNPNFNHLLIPDVGAAPVFAFQMLITLFAIAIGPVNYWLLKRKNQLPLLLLTVPLAALVTTLMLFAYGMFADGIGVRVRARSLAMLDQRVGEVASWARLSYYAGIAPSDGLTMPIDTVLYPILPSRSEYNRFGNSQINQQRELEWDSRQRMVRGWLGSRTPTQYLAVTARPSTKRLDIESQGGKCTATNHFDTNVLALFVQDKEGNIFAGGAIDAESTTILQPTTFPKAVSQLRMWLTENLPQLPAGYVEGSGVRQLEYGASMSDSLMELQMEAIISPLATGWGNGTYVAITEKGIEVPLGIEDVSETNSFHVVRGTW